MDKQLEDDLYLSHAFINALSASYQGFYVYVNAMEQLAPSAETNQAAQKIATLIETINGWWEDFKAHRILHAKGIYHIENMANLGLLPPKGAWIVVAPLPIQGGSGSPCRVFGFIPRK